MDENKECCCSRTKVRSDAEYRDLITRLNRIEGQIRGIRGMVEKDAYEDVREGNEEKLDELVRTLQKLMK